MSTEVNIDPGDGAVMFEVIDLLDRLRQLDTEPLHRVLATGNIAINVLPPNMAEVTKLMLIDIALITTFADEAKKYDHTEQSKKALKELFKPKNN